MSNRILKNVQSYKVNSNSNISYSSSNNISSVNGDSNVKVEEYSFDDSLKPLNNDSIKSSSDEQKISTNDNIFVNPSIAEFDKTNVSGSKLDSLGENEVYVSKDDIDSSNLNDSSTSKANSISSNSFKKENEDILIDHNVSRVNNLVHDSISAYDDSENMEV